MSTRDVAGGPEFRIAIVDDDEGFRDSLTALLDSVGFACSTFASVEALIAALDGSIGAVVLDVHMPGLQGSAAVRALQRIMPAMRIISVSGRAEPGDAQMILSAGAWAYLEKPFLLDALLRHLPR